MIAERGEGGKKRDAKRWRYNVTLESYGFVSQYNCIQCEQCKQQWLNCKDSEFSSMQQGSGRTKTHTRENLPIQYHF